MLFLPPAPPAIVIAAAQTLPPLSFVGFRARMPLADAEALARAAGGTLSCRQASDSRIRECRGVFPSAGFPAPLSLLISSVKDSAAVIVLSQRAPKQVVDQLVSTLSMDFGVPNQSRESGIQMTWEWIRRGQMLRLVQREAADHMEVAVTLTDGPLLDGLGSPQRKRPD